MPRSRGLTTHIWGVGRLYVAWQPENPEDRILTKAWIIEMAPPYRVGHGLRLRFGRRSVQVGICRRFPESHPLQQVGGRQLLNTSEQIGTWWNGRGPNDQVEAEGG